MYKGSSRCYALITFSRMVTDHLVVTDNVFANGARSAFDLYISPMSDDARVDIENNFFFSNIQAVTLRPAMYKGNMLREISIRNNSFILNCPYNPHPTSGNVGALMLWHRESCLALNIKNNLFAFNPGGAMQHDWKECDMPDMAIRDNLFYMNASLFKNDEADAGFLVGKFGPNPSYLIYNAMDAADDLDYVIEGNVSFDPHLQCGKEDFSKLTGLYAPRMSVAPGDFPFPENPKAASYGVQAAKALKFEPGSK